MYYFIHINIQVRPSLLLLFVLLSLSCWCDFFQVGESIRTSNYNYEILGKTKVSLWVQTTWHFLFKKEKIFLTDFVRIFMQTKTSLRSRFFILLFMWFKLKLQNASEKLFLNEIEILDIEINDTNEQIFNIMTKTNHFCAKLKNSLL